MTGKYELFLKRILNRRVMKLLDQNRRIRINSLVYEFD